MARWRSRRFSSSKVTESMGARSRSFSSFSFFFQSLPRRLAARGSTSVRFPASSIEKRRTSGKLVSGSPSTRTARTRSRPFFCMKYSSSLRHHRLSRYRGEQMAMNQSLWSRAVSMSLPRLAERGSSS